MAISKVRAAKAGADPIHQFMSPEDICLEQDERTKRRTAAQPFPGATKRVATYMWREAGEPEKDSEPTSVGRAWYEDRAAEVLRALAEMGYVVTKPTTKVAKGVRK